MGIAVLPLATPPATLGRNLWLPPGYLSVTPLATPAKLNPRLPARINPRITHPPNTPWDTSSAQGLKRLLLLLEIDGSRLGKLSSSSSCSVRECITISNDTPVCPYVRPSVLPSVTNFSVGKLFLGSAREDEFL